MKMLGTVATGGLVLAVAFGAIAAERQPGKQFGRMPGKVAGQHTGKVTGKLAQKGGVPLSGGLAFFFNMGSGPPPSPDKYWRVPDEIAELDADGRFNTELIPGTYFVGAIKRAVGKEVGPPAEGDLFLVARDASQMPRSFVVTAGGHLDLGTIAEAIPYHKPAAAKEITGIAGQVVDAENKPVPGVYVFAYLTPAMIGRPLFASEKTGLDGKFLLRVAEGGNYYLKVRELYGGGPPRQGGIIGGYGDETPKAVTVKSGSVTSGITVKGLKFPGRGQPQK